MKKIGILTFQRTSNYGAQFQNFALQKYLQKNGWEVETIDYLNENLDAVERPQSFFHQKSIKEMIKFFKCHKYRQKKWEGFENFRNEYIKFSEKYDKDNISSIENKYDCIIVGSDQVWNTDITGNDYNYFLSFIKDKEKKLSYAASFGYSEIPVNIKNKVLNYLKDFKVLNLREKTGLNIVKDLPCKNKNVVLDPTFLLDEDQYINFFDLKKDDSEKYIFVYMYDENKTNIDFIKKLAEENDCKIKFVRDGFKDLDGLDSLRDISPREFLQLLYNAKYVVTGSFHGTCLSIIFQKQFYYNLNKTYNRNSRIVDLLELLHLSNRNDFSSNEEIDYKNVYLTLKKEIVHSKNIISDMTK